MHLITDEAGAIHNQFFVDGEFVVEESFYPLCGMAVETSFVSGNDKITVQPDTYLQRVFSDAE